MIAGVAKKDMAVATGSKGGDFCPLRLLTVPSQLHTYSERLVKSLALA
jgi:hypothetical protein